MKTQSAFGNSHEKTCQFASIALLCGGVFSSQAWEGHDWNQWRQVTTWQKPELHTHQVGRRELAPLLGGDATDPQRITSVSGWEERRKEIAEAIQQILGQPGDLKKPAVEVRELGSEELEGYTRRHIEIRTEPDDWIPAYLLVPKKLAQPRVPTMLCLHQTVAQGKEEPCGIKGDPELAIAVELVQRGYVCIAPDVIGFGERIEKGTQPYHNNIAFFRKHPGWSCMGKMVWDVSRVIDYLETLPFVDTRRIGSIGHSHGAYGTLFAAAFEPRISVAIASCGFTTIRSDPHPERWSHLTPLIPQLGFYLPDVAAVPFDWQDICALIAPRPLFVWYATKDAIFPETSNLDALFKDVKGVYELYGAGDRLAWQAFDGPHKITAAGRKAAYEWLAKQWGEIPRPGGPASASWQYGAAQTRITPAKLFWMGGFAARTRPAEGTLDDLCVKALALEAPDGDRMLVVTADLVGIPKWLYEDLCSELKRRYGLERRQIRFAASHTHSGPVLKDALQDVYPLDDNQRSLIAEYSSWLERAMLTTVDKALAELQPATLSAGEGKATFAMNRRENKESDLPDMLRRGESPKGPSDFAVPVLAVRSPEGALRAVVFGYAAHTSALTPQNYRWSSDYAGVTQRALEAKHPGVTAMFFQGCGSDQSAVPRGTVELCHKLGEKLATAVEAVLEQPMRPVTPKFRSAFEFVALDFGEQPSKTELETAAKGNDYRARWARRLLSESAKGRTFEQRYAEYPVQVWKLGDDQLWVALGGEVCVDYVLRFKKEYGPQIWVNGYANDVMAYIPSRRIWEEGGYQAGAFEVYGLPANRWCPDIEDRITGAVARLMRQIR
jgi:dienelactone hydrolase